MGRHAWIRLLSVRFSTTLGWECQDAGGCSRTRALHPTGWAAGEPGPFDSRIGMEITLLREGGSPWAAGLETVRGGSAPLGWMARGALKAGPPARSGERGREAAS